MKKITYVEATIRLHGIYCKSFELNKRINRISYYEFSTLIKERGECISEDEFNKALALSPFSIVNITMPELSALVESEGTESVVKFVKDGILSILKEDFSKKAVNGLIPLEKVINMLEGFLEVTSPLAEKRSKLVEAFAKSRDAEEMKNVVEGFGKHLSRVAVGKDIAKKVIPKKDFDKLDLAFGDSWVD
jgi:hypothetical protein